MQAKSTQHTRNHAVGAFHSCTRVAIEHSGKHWALYMHIANKTHHTHKTYTNTRTQRALTSCARAHRHTSSPCRRRPAPRPQSPPWGSPSGRRHARQTPSCAGGALRAPTTTTRSARPGSSAEAAGRKEIKSEHKDYINTIKERIERRMEKRRKERGAAHVAHTSDASHHWFRVLIIFSSWPGRKSRAIQKSTWKCLSFWSSLPLISPA